MYEELKTGNNDYKNIPLNFARERELTPKSLDVKSGGKFAIANFVTLFAVKWI